MGIYFTYNGELNLIVLKLNQERAGKFDKGMLNSSNSLFASMFYISTITMHIIWSIDTA